MLAGKKANIQEEVMEEAFVIPVGCGKPCPLPLPEVPFEIPLDFRTPAQSILVRISGNDQGRMNIYFVLERYRRR